MGIGCTGGTGGGLSGAGGKTLGSCGAGNAGSPPSAIFTYNILCIVDIFFLS